MNDSYEYRLERAKTAIADAEYILIGGGAGLSEAAGLTYSGKRFTDNFADFIQHYEMTDMYTATFYPFKTQEEKWAYFSKHIYINRFDGYVGQIYKDLFRLAKDKKYFVITTNVDGQFYSAGFAPEKVFAVQGDYGKLQCAKGCHDKLYDNEYSVKEMLARQKDCKIPSELIPKCPKCGGDMEVNLRKDLYFVQDEVWYDRNKQFEFFVKEAQNKKIALLEIGVGFNTPGIIRYPFEQITYKEPNATLIRINRDYFEAIRENTIKTISFNEDINYMF